eukprot:CAMPEP_0184511918 /NCGR_PEP_ID=MMETSP0198_2-20121128/2604_1 /TAXON_ID=1112570 /ORGANISM="Thraustochytrium sp., Strain LLF1b" /LENGTH=202 /DNA_ID=CAMNT_0026901909 /DNA_START=427 /DNA_END=1035 /DNA_ORIENTATION=-
MAASKLLSRLAATMDFPGQLPQHMITICAPVDEAVKDAKTRFCCQAGPDDLNLSDDSVRCMLCDGVFQPSRPIMWCTSLRDRKDENSCDETALLALEGNTKQDTGTTCKMSREVIVLDLEDESTLLAGNSNSQNVEAFASENSDDGFVLTGRCPLVAHPVCLAGELLKHRSDTVLIPTEGACPVCGTNLSWPVLVRDARYST